MEDAWRTALLAGNPAPLEPIIADDFLGIGANGTISNKAQYLENLHAGRFAFKSMDVESTNIRMLRDVAIVNSTIRIDATLHGSPYRGLFRYTRVYRLIGNEWKVINFEATRVSGSGSNDDMQRGQPLPTRPVQR
ncbi:MAG: nuclear transport factor 2 family protein [Acidobacteria bacterium]|nr:nuclear transport factor 2 family protein [Acidobacteriota bacterium]